MGQQSHARAERQIERGTGLDASPRVEAAQRELQSPLMQRVVVQKMRGVDLRVRANEAVLVETIMGELRERGLDLRGVGLRVIQYPGGVRIRAVARAARV